MGLDKGPNQNLFSLKTYLNILFVFVLIDALLVLNVNLSSIFSSWSDIVNVCILWNPRWKTTPTKRPHFFKITFSDNDFLNEPLVIDFSSLKTTFGWFLGWFYHQLLYSIHLNKETFLSENFVELTLHWSPKIIMTSSPTGYTTEAIANQNTELQCVSILTNKVARKALQNAYLKTHAHTHTHTHTHISLMRWKSR